VITNLDFQTPDGSRLRQWPVGALGDSVGAATIGLSRADLHGVLADALPSGTLQFASEVTGVTETGDGVTVTLADGREVEGDVLIGADGAFSTLRQQRLGRGRPEFPPYSSYTLWHSIIPYAESAVPGGVFFLIFGRGTRFSYFRIDDERVYWSAIAYVPAGGKEATAAHVAELFREYAEPVRGLIGATADADVHRTDIFGGEGLPSWGSGRVTLLGDAAHPMTTNLGQGAGMAIEDGVVLAHELALAGSAESGLRAYESRRRERVERMMALANKLNSSASLETPFRTWLRNQLLKHLFYRGLGSKWEQMLTEDLLPPQASEPELLAAPA
jgi:2-polyprenyl-6-methoxyphenol hydroxylase-like FAD-dependent oxidoreductase